MSDDLPFGIHTLVIPFTWEGRRAASPVTGRMTRMRPAGWHYRNGVPLHHSNTLPDIEGYDADR